MKAALSALKPRVTLPVTIQNSSLSATMTPLDFGNTAPVQGTYHIQVAANAANVSSISLFSTGGLWNSVANQSSTTFNVDGPALGVGLHPFYAGGRKPRRPKIPQDLYRSA